MVKRPITMEAVPAMFNQNPIFSWKMIVDACSMTDINNGLFCVEYVYTRRTFMHSVAVEYKISNKIISPELHVKYTKTVMNPVIQTQMWIYPTFDVFWRDFECISQLKTVPDCIYCMNISRMLGAGSNKNYRKFRDNCFKLKYGMIDSIKILNKSLELTQHRLSIEQEHMSRGDESSANESNANESSANESSDNQSNANESNANESSDNNDSDDYGECSG